MCLEHKGRNAYARILVEMSVDREWKKTIEVTTWDFMMNCDVSQEFVVEYAWCPSRCGHCKAFGHFEKFCMVAMSGKEKVKELIDPVNVQNSKGKGIMDNEGFIEVVRK